MPLLVRDLGPSASPPLCPPSPTNSPLPLPHCFCFLIFPFFSAFPVLLTAALGVKKTRCQDRLQLSWCDIHRSGTVAEQWLGPATIPGHKSSLPSSCLHAPGDGELTTYT